MQVRDIPLADIKGTVFHMRSETKQLEPELVESIRDHGLMQPILLRPKGKSYQIVAGTRRFEAVQSLKRKSIAAIVQDLDDKSAFEIALTENIQRRNMEPIEEARAFGDYLDKYKWGSVSELAKKINRRPSYIVDRLTLIEQPREVQKYVERKDISASAAEEIGRLEKPEEKIEVAKAVIEERLDVPQTAAVVDYVKQRKMPVERAVEVVKIEQRAKRAADEVVESFKEAVIESGRDIERMRGTEERKLMENYIFLGTVLQAMKQGTIYCTKHENEPPHLSWTCGTTLDATHQSIKEQLKLR